jgi:hypothetical protein
MYNIKEDLKECKKVSVLVPNFPGIDSTLFFNDGTFWLFTNILENSVCSLHIFFSDNLRGPYASHPMNPIKSNMSSTRSAGNIFFRGTKIFRPSQNLVKTYGGSIIVNRIISLSKNYYEEKPSYVVEPFKLGSYSLQGIHHLGSVGDKTLFDFKVREEINK